jgi:hypothetical protein
MDSESGSKKQQTNTSFRRLSGRSSSKACDKSHALPRLRPSFSCWAGHDNDQQPPSALVGRGGLLGARLEHSLATGTVTGRQDMFAADTVSAHCTVFLGKVVSCVGLLPDIGCVAAQFCLLRRQSMDLEGEGERLRSSPWYIGLESDTESLCRYCAVRGIADKHM